MKSVLSVAAMLVLAGAVWALDVADMTIEWTPEGKKLAAERIKLPARMRWRRSRPAGS